MAQTTLGSRLFLVGCETTPAMPNLTLRDNQVFYGAPLWMAAMLGTGPSLTINISCLDLVNGFTVVSLFDA